MTRFSVDRAAFAAERRGAMERGDEILGPAVAASLSRFGEDNWEAAILGGVTRLWEITSDAEGGTTPPTDLIVQVRASLAQTSAPTEPPDPVQVSRITRWLSALTVNAATVAAAVETADGEVVLLEWVTMHDDAVREKHRQVDGMTVPLGETFDVGGFDLHYPGEPVGPPDIWIECRCVARPTQGGEEMANKTAQFADEVIEDIEVDPDAPVVEEGITDEIPWHGVLAPINIMSGDRRIFEDNAITWRDLPQPLRWVKADIGSHGGAVRVATIREIHEEDGLIKASGTMLDTPEAQEAIALMAISPLGVSVDLDMMTAREANDDGSDFDAEAWEPGDPIPVMSVTEGRIAAATLVDIPAFQEAYVALGPWPTEEEEVVEEVPTALMAAGECVPCMASSVLEGFTEEQRDEFEAALATQAADLEGGILVLPESLADVERGFLDLLTDRLNAQGVEFAPGTKDGPGWLTNPRDTQRLRNYWTKGPGAAKIAWGTPGDFNRCRRQLAKYVKNPRFLAGTCANLHKVALGVWPGQETGRHRTEGVQASAFYLVEESDSLVAAGSVRRGSWFGDPNLLGPTPLTITEDGQVYGHVATWGVCHIGMGLSIGQGGACQTAPHSATDYAYFKTGAVMTDRGEIAVGNITMGTGHAAHRAKAAPAIAHYDNTGAVVADVNVGEDEFGIWFAGALRPNLSDDQVDALRAATLSGDWRNIGKELELVATLAVNVPGFPIPRVTLAASAHRVESLVAAAPVKPRTSVVLDALQVGVVMANLDAKEFAREVHKEMVRIEDRSRRLATVREKARSIRLADARRMASGR